MHQDVSSLQRQIHPLAILDRRIQELGNEAYYDVLDQDANKHAAALLAEKNRVSQYLRQVIQGPNARSNDAPGVELYLRERGAEKLNKVTQFPEVIFEEALPQPQLWRAILTRGSFEIGHSYMSVYTGFQARKCRASRIRIALRDVLFAEGRNDSNMWRNSSINPFSHVSL